MMHESVNIVGWITSKLSFTVQTSVSEVISKTFVQTGQFF